MSKRVRAPRRKRAAAPAEDGGFSRWLPPVIVGAALVARLVVLAQLGDHPLLEPRGVLDDGAYMTLARRVASGDLELGPDVYFLPPFYTYFLGFVFALTGGSLQAARLVQVLLGAGAVALILWTATSWFGRRAGLVAGAMAAATGLFAFHEILILHSSLDPFLTALALFSLTRAVRGGSSSWFAASGLAFGALVLNRPNALPAAAAVALMWAVSRRSRVAVRQAVALGLGTALLVAPIALRNRMVAGEWVLITSHGGLNFSIGNGEGADGTWRMVPGIRPSIEGQQEDMRRAAGEALGRTASAREASSYFYGLAWRWIASHPGEWAKLLARKLALAFNAGEASLNYSFAYYARDESSLLSVLVIGPWLVVPLGLFGLVASAPAGERASYLAWAVFTPAYALSLVLFFVSSRYRLPLLVPLLIGAGAAVNVLATKLSTLRARALAPVAGVLAALFALAHWPLRIDDGRLLEREERIVQLVSDGRIEEGLRLLAETEPRHPAPDLMLYRAGLAFLDRGDAARAIEHLERALAANPEEPSIRLVLGRALLSSGRPGEAIEHLEAALASGIAPAGLPLARAYQASGEDERAVDALARVPVSPPTDAGTLLALGITALELRDPALAERFLREAVSREPERAEARVQLGIALGRQQRVEEAVSELEAAVRLDGTSPEAHYYLALGYAQQGRLSEARARAESALKLRPDYAEAGELLSRLTRG